MIKSQTRKLIVNRHFHCLPSFADVNTHTWKAWIIYPRWHGESVTLGVPNSVSKALLSTLDQPPAAGSQLRSASIAHIYPLYLLKKAAETLKTGSHSFPQSIVGVGNGSWHSLTCQPLLVQQETVITYWPASWHLEKVIQSFKTCQSTKSKEIKRKGWWTRGSRGYFPVCPVEGQAGNS